MREVIQMAFIKQLNTIHKILAWDNVLSDAKDKNIALMPFDIHSYIDTFDDIKIINGPKGKNFIVHVDIPENVKAAFEELKSVYGNKIREVHRLNSVSYMANLS